MTNQFKFGDRVRYKSPESKLRGFVASTHNRGQKKIIVAFEGEGWLHHCSPKNLELIPPPDTVRLDWLADPANKIGSVILPTECVERHLDSLRDAIDAAMQIQATEDA